MYFTKESLAYLHGEIVGTSLILQLAYNHTPEKIPAFKDFMEKMGMPVTLSELGIPETKDNIKKIYDYLLTTPFIVDTPENRQTLMDSIKAICK